MKFIFISAVFGSVVLAASGVALGADLPVKAPVMKAPSPPVISWTGPYIGANIGWIGSNNQVTDLDGSQDPPGTVHKYRSSGVTGGVYAGYNWQIAPTWVLGLEADISSADARSSSFLSDTALQGFELDATAESKIYWTSTFRARLGFLVTPVTLLYGTGGLAVARIRNTIVDTDNGEFDPRDSVSGTSTRTGWVAGGGVEHMFSPNVTGRVEGLYMDFSDKTLTTPSTDTGGESFKFQNTIAIVRAGVAWKW